jgi:hypothetical protein
MSALIFDIEERRTRLGLKGPRAAEWLIAQDIVLPMAANSWVHSDAGGGSGELLVARLGAAEFFLEDAADGYRLAGISLKLKARPPGVYPVLREDCAFQLSGDGVHDVLAQVCNVEFAGLVLDSHPVIMTLMIGVAVLIVPQESGAERRYRIWCDPTFGLSLCENLEAVVVDCGGITRGVSA